MCKQMGECKGRSPKARQERSSELSWRREALERRADLARMEEQRIRLLELRKGQKAPQALSLWVRLWGWVCSR